VLVATWRQAGPAGCARKLRAAVGVGLPALVGARRSARSVGAYFDTRSAKLEELAVPPPRPCHRRARVRAAQERVWP